jgi:DNA-directed RNA polymerase specialized sigma24 family protein
MGDVTHWLHQLKAGDRAAARPLWERYFRRLVGLARERLRGLPRAGRDEEDLALSAFDSFYRAAEAGRFPHLDDSLDLWQVLSLIASRKAYDLVQQLGRMQCDYRRTQPLDGEDVPEPMSKELDPAEIAELTEATGRLLALLPDDRSRFVALRKLEGYTNEEIKQLQGCALVTVERELRLIRKFWKQELPV